MDKSRFTNIIYRVSYFSLVSATYALYRGHYDLVLVPGGVFLTSIQYWSDPTNVTKRYIDMTYVTSALIYQIRSYVHVILIMQYGIIV